MAGEKDSIGILRARAERLSRAERTSEVAAVEPIVAFMASGHCFGVRLDHVVYAGRLRHLTPLPGGSPYLLGITVLAGHLVSVLDVAAFLDLRQQGLGDVTCCLVVQAGGREIGLAAEQLIGFEDVPAQRIAPIGSLNGANGTPIVSSAAMLERFRILIIELDRLIGDPRLGKPRGVRIEGGNG